MSLSGEARSGSGLAESCGESSEWCRESSEMVGEILDGEEWTCWWQRHRNSLHCLHRPPGVRFFAGRAALWLIPGGEFMRSASVSSLFMSSRSTSSCLSAAAVAALCEAPRGVELGGLAELERGRFVSLLFLR
jgi:hypothetical protein